MHGGASVAGLADYLLVQVNRVDVSSTEVVQDQRRAVTGAAADFHDPGARRQRATEPPQVGALYQRCSARRAGLSTTHVSVLFINMVHSHLYPAMPSSQHGNQVASEFDDLSSLQDIIWV